ncbi:hypothetical protein K1719_046887 [Acacia pycnantha]|nr:hypothetical protein K1719_046887 [Acacia pycnantha]
MIQKVETLYGWSYDAYPCDKKPEYQPNGTLRCSKCDKDVLMTVPKYKIHYKVYDDTGKCSIIFFDRHATELLGKYASKIKEDMKQVQTGNVIELITPTDINSKRKKLTRDMLNVSEDLGLFELSTPKLSSTKPMKNILKEKF